jgi:phospholipid/cholesterol/gamma-HCH transport system substrate-binding protein
MSNEIKFGIFAVLAIGAFIVGMSYLKGSSLFGSSLRLQAAYPNAEGLIPGNPVKIKGVKVGRINTMELEGDSVLVSFKLDPYRPIPVDSRAEVYSISILGEMGIKLVLGKSTEMLKDGQKMAAGIEPGMIESLTERVTESELVDNLTVLTSELAVLGKNMNSSLGGADGSQTKLGGIINDLKATTGRTELLMVKLTDVAESFSKLAKNTNTIIAEVAEEKGALSGAANNLKLLSDSLAASSGELKSIASGTNKAVGELGEVIEKVNDPEGSLGKLINDPGLYNSIDKVARQANALIENIQADPAHYRKLLDVDVSVFPKRDRRSKEVRNLQNELDAKLLEQAIDSLEDE